MANKRGRKTRKGGVRESRSLTKKLQIHTYNVIIKHKKQIIEELEDLEKLFKSSKSSKSNKSKRNPRHSHTKKNIKKLKDEIRDYKEKIAALKRKTYTK